jgi:hypothetical protein
MKKKLKVKAQIDGAEREIEIELDTDSPPAGFIAEEKHGELMQQEVSRSFERGKRNARQALLRDEEFQAEASETWGLVKKGEASKGTLKPEELSTHLESWRKSELKPVQEKMTALEQTNTTLLNDILAREIVAEASRLGMKDTFVEGVSGDMSKATVVAMFAHRLAFDPETRSHAVRSGDSWEFNPKGSKERPYKGPRELLEQFKADERNADFFKNSRQEVPGAGGDGARGGGDSKTVSRSDLTSGSVDLEGLAKGSVKVAD